MLSTFNDINLQKIYFSSIVKKDLRGSLESLLFFNEQQDKFFKDIIRSIDTFGIPDIITDGELLRIRVGEYIDAQSIFAFNGDNDDANLIGLIIYFRNSKENIMVLHIAVDEKYSPNGKFSDQILALKLINKVREAGRFIKGVKSLSIAYGGDLNNITTISVK